MGEQFLLQAETSNLMNEWYSTIQTAIDQAVSDVSLHTCTVYRFFLSWREVSNGRGYFFVFKSWDLNLEILI